MTRDLIDRADALAAIALGDTVSQLQAKILAIPAAAIPARGVGVKDFDVEIVRGNTGGNLSLYFNNHRVAGSKPWGGGTTIHSFRVQGDEVKSSGIFATIRNIQTVPDDKDFLTTAALAPTDAAHVNETPKTEHDGADMLTDYTLAPHLQKIVEGAKAATQWDMQADRLAPTDAAQAREAAMLHIENAKRLRRYDWQEWTAQDVEDAEGVICAFLATTEAAHVNETPKSEHDAGNALTAAQAREAGLKDTVEVIALAAQEAREAALREAADLADTTFDCSGTDAARIIRNAILALIKEDRT